MPKRKSFILLGSGSLVALLKQAVSDCATTSRSRYVVALEKFDREAKVCVATMTNLMLKIAVLDDDEHWCLAIQRFFRTHFDVTTFTDAQSFLSSALDSYALVIIDFTIAPLHRHETSTNGIEIIHQLKTQLKQPPLAILTSAFISRSDLSIDHTLGSQADVIMPKDCGLDEILQTTQSLLHAQELLNN